MTETASLVIKVDSSGAKRASDDLNKLGTAAGGTERAANKLGKAWGVALGVVGSAVVIGATKAYIRMADEMTNLNARLRLATNGQDSFNKAQAATYRIAQTTGTALAPVIDLYARAAQASEMLGISQEDTARLTETVSKALTISGTAAGQQGSVILQLSQALASGKVQAEEFNSIIDGAPRIVQALADKLGIAFGEVKGYVTAGRVSSKLFAEALLEASEAVDREFSTMPLTVSRATQEVRNALMGMVDDANTTSGATAGLAKTVAELARTLEDPATKNGFAAVVSGIVGIANAAAVAVTELAALWERAQRFTTLAIGGAGNGSDLKQIDYEIQTHEAQIASWKDGGVKEFLAGPDIANARKRLDELRELRRQSIDLFGDPSQPRVLFSTDGAMPEGMLRPKGSGVTPPTTSPDTKKTKGLTDEQKAVQDLARAYESYNSRLHEGVELHGQQTELARLNYEIQSGALKGISEEQQKVLREQAEWADWMDEMADIESVWADASQERTDRMIDGWSKATDELSEFAKQAARNMQDAFADFLFDPFENGVSGMLTSFAKALQRMAAEAAASKLFDALGTWGEANKGAGGWQGFVSSIVSNFGNKGTGGGKAAGGPLQAGSAYTVGDGGKPELFVPNTSGTLYPMSKGGGGGLQVVINNNSGAKVTAREEKQASSNGGPDIRKLVIDMVAGDIASGGATASAMKGRFGMREAV